MYRWNIYFDPKESMINANPLAINFALIRKKLVAFAHVYICDITYSTKESLSQLISIWCVEKPNGSLCETADNVQPT